MKLLTNSGRTSGPLLARAAQQHVTPVSMRTEINWGTCTCFINDIMRPDSNDWELGHSLPETKLFLYVKSSVKSGKAF